MGVAPTISRKRSAKTERDMPDAFGQGLKGPGAAGVVVDAGDGEAHVLVGEGREPARGGAGVGVGEVQAEGLDEHHVGELLRDEGSAGLGVA